MKKFIALALAFLMVFALATTAFAQTVGTASDGPATITISNAAKGETYAVYKLFDATVTGTENGPIAYSGTIPESLKAYFTADVAGNITATDAAKATDGSASEALRTALEAWVETATATATAVSDGSELTFSGLPYGYYVVTTTQGKSTITVDSTNPSATIVDKNSTTPGDLTKTVDEDDVNIGDTVTYTVSFTTSNYDGAGTNAKQITEYTITDTLPEFLSNVTVTSIIVDNDASGDTTDDQIDVTDQFENKKITIDWYDEAAGAFRYENGAKVTITYTATVTDSAAIDGEGNENEVELTWKTKNGPDGSVEKKSVNIYTYAIALKKVNDKGVALSGATFQFPFYVKENPAADGAYIYAGTEAGTGLTNTLTTPESGLIIVKGVATGKYSITETVAPNGYNKLTAPVSVTATKTSETTTSTTTYLDAEGNVVDTETTGGSTVLVEIKELAATPVVVVNKTGVELPSTGGMGTTVFYVIGAVLMLGAVVVLVSRKRMAA